MYPAWQLRRLAAQKAALRRRIALRRAECAEAAARIARPLAWLDRVVAFWRRLPPLAQFAAGPLASLVTQVVFPRRGILGKVARWGPLAFSVLRSFTGARRPEAAP